MGVQVPLLPLHPRRVGVDVLELPGDISGAARPHVGHGRVNGHAGGVGLGPGGQENGRLGQGELGLWQAQLQRAVHTGLHDGHRLGVGQAHVLAGGAQQPPDGGDQVPRLQQPGQVVDRRVRIGAPEGFHQGGGDVVVVVPLPVVAHGGFLGRRLGVLQGNHQLSPLPPGGGGEQLQGVHGLADVPAAGGGDVLPHPVLQHQGPAQPLIEQVHPPVNGGEGVLGGDLLELKHRGPGEHRPEHVEEGVLGGGGDEGDLPVFHELQQGLLLLFVKVLDLVQVQQHPVRGQEGADVGNDVLNVRDGRRGGVEPVEGAVGALGDDVGHRGLSRPRGAVEDQVGDVAPLDDPAQQAVLS